MNKGFTFSRRREQRERMAGKASIGAAFAIGILIGLMVMIVWGLK